MGNSTNLLSKDISAAHQSLLSASNSILTNTAQLANAANDFVALVHKIEEMFTELAEKEEKLNRKEEELQRKEEELIRKGGISITKTEEFEKEEQKEEIATSTLTQPITNEDKYHALIQVC